MRVVFLLLVVAAVSAIQERKLRQSFMQESHDAAHNTAMLLMEQAPKLSANGREQVMLTARAGAKEHGRPALTHRARVDRIKRKLVEVTESGDYSSSTTATVVRKNALHLTDAELTQFTKAVLALKIDMGGAPQGGASNFSRLDRYAWAHNVGATYGAIHVGGLILPWHRTWLRTLEIDLQRVANNDSLAIPYWDIGDANSREGVFSDKIMGGNGSAASPFEISSGPYAQWTVNVGHYHLSECKIERCLGCATHLPPLCAWVSAMTSEVYAHYPFEQGGGRKNCNTSFTAWLAKSHYKIHNFQLSTGDFMPGGDPLTMLIHSYLDKLWMIWQLYWYGDGDDGLWGYRPGWHYNHTLKTSPYHAIWFFNNTIASVLNPHEMPYTYSFTDRIDGTFMDIVSGGDCGMDVGVKITRQTTKHQANNTWCMDDKANFPCKCTSLPAPFIP